MPPDYLTPQEQKELDDLVDLQIDTAIEEKHLHETVPDDDTEEQWDTKNVEIIPA